MAVGPRQTAPRVGSVSDTTGLRLRRLGFVKPVVGESKPDANPIAVPPCTPLRPWGAPGVLPAHGASQFGDFLSPLCVPPLLPPPCRCAPGGPFRPNPPLTYFERIDTESLGKPRETPSPSLLL